MDHSTTGGLEEPYYAQARDFVQRHLPPCSGLQVTLTYAQSLDGMIAARPGQQLLLSSRAAMAMTHRMRAHHDAILVGIGTVLADDPQLSARLLPSSEMPCHPQPVVLDPHLRMPATARLLSGPRADPRLHSPWIIAGPHADPAKRQELQRLGATVISVDQVDQQGRPLLDAVAAELSRRGVRRLMVEGGAHIIQAFLASVLVNTLVVTIAPVFVGVGGVTAACASAAHAQTFPNIRPLAYEQFGTDVVMVASVQQ
ncbi:2,5-diamino-6-(ribosylamino)-4(3H)-pyrimidinone 5'-phosphate reductase [Coemansia sp. RSA 2322]|nr:2,5-diamino-6-(ribosylamino)-4(3H)-pyrimidinone 5'-phosphate reductase [Coemansia sp. RSA 2322]